MFWCFFPLQVRLEYVLPQYALRWLLWKALRQVFVSASFSLLSCLVNTAANVFQNLCLRDAEIDHKVLFLKYVRLKILIIEKYLEWTKLALTCIS